MEKQTKEKWVEYFTYLDELRESGVTNMFGAAPYLTEEYGLDRYTAKKVLLAWMETYDENKSVEERVING